MRSTRSAAGCRRWTRRPREKIRDRGVGVRPPTATIRA
jgi:hypothetical protein